MLNLNVNGKVFCVEAEPNTRLFWPRACMVLVPIVALLKQTPQRTDAGIGAAITKICSWGTYSRFRPAIYSASWRSPHV